MFARESRGRWSTGSRLLFVFIKWILDWKNNWRCQAGEATAGGWGSCRYHSIKPFLSYDLYEMCSVHVSLRGPQDDWVYGEMACLQGQPALLRISCINFHSGAGRSSLPALPGSSLEPPWTAEASGKKTCAPYTLIQITIVGEDVEKIETLCTAGGIANCYSQYGKQFGNSSNN